MGTNYAEEQQNELEALQAIYPDELEVVAPGQYQITVKSQDYDLDAVSGCMCTLAFRCTAKYPDDLPEVEMMEEPDNCEPVEVEQLMETLQHEAESNVGMCSVFSIISAAAEWLNNHSDELRARKERERERIIQEKEDAERKRFEGTRVTVESFVRWKEVFEAEMNALRQERDRHLEAQRRGKLSGYELFTTDSSLVDSDVKFLQDAGDDVVVDESLFQDLDDLELSDEEELDGIVAA